MSSIQGLQGVSAAPVAPATAPKAKVTAPAQTAKPEFQETAQEERAEANRGAQEVAESLPSQGGPSVPGSKLSVMA